MKPKMMEKAKLHYSQLMDALEEMGMSMEAFMETMEEEPSEMVIPEAEEEMEESEEEQGGKKAKIAMLVAKMRGYKDEQE
jgi:hypothetical protein